MAAGYGLEDREVGIRVPVGSRIFSFPRRPDRLWGPPGLLKWVPGILSPGVNGPGREADHPPQTNAEVKKNMDLYIHSPTFLHGVVLKDSDNITFYRSICIYTKAYKSRREEA
jgi:hypothetical protein